MSLTQSNTRRGLRALEVQQRRLDLYACPSIPTRVNVKKLTRLHVARA
jgi:hypothetical protein